MITKIIEFSAHNKYFVLLCTLVAMIWAVFCVKNVPLDAIPDLSDTQVIVYSRWDKSPDIIEDQVTYPIVTSLLGAPKVKSIRGFSDFGYSYVYVIFEDNTDLYWARSRTLEYLSKITPTLPEGVKTELGPDATGVGWVYQYALKDESNTKSPADLRSLQDWNLRYSLQSVPGVAEVTSIGGYVKQYQVNIDPAKLLSTGISLTTVLEKVRQSNQEVSGRLLEMSGREYMIRGHGYITSLADIENIVIGGSSGQPILIKHVGVVQKGPDMRRGVAELNGEGETVGGIVVMRSGENALNVINRVKERIEEIKPGLPKGVKIIPVYDRSDIILRAIHTLKNTLVEEMIIVSLVILVFLWHIPSALIPIFTIPISVLLAFIPMYYMGLTSNIMSLSGIAISMGVLVDGAIVEVENAYKKLEAWQSGGRVGDFHEVRLNALKEVGPSVFFSLLVIAISFIPIFTLLDQEGRLFKPLAFSKNLTMAIAAILAITLDPAMRMLFTRMSPYQFKPLWLSKISSHVLVGKYYPEEKHPISHFLYKIYEPICRFVLKYPKKVIGASVALFLLTVPIYFKLGSEFMPTLNEGAIVYMPTTLPGVSIAEATKSLILQDKIIKSFPEVESVFGKVGRAETATDPAPLSMVETTIVLKPKSEWRFKTWEELISALDAAVQIPGWTNAWTMPIKNRIDMLATGIRTPIGIKVLGNNIQQIEKVGIEIEKLIKDNIKGTRSVYAERVAGGYFLDFDLKREELARYGLSVQDAQTIISSAIGGENITTTIEGRERYPVNVRYKRELRDSLDDLNRVLIPLANGAQIPISEIASLNLRMGPSMIRDEDGLLAGYVYVDTTDSDVGGYVARAKKILDSHLELPEGVTLRWSGQFENMIRVKERLKLIIPLTLFLVFLLLYANTKSAIKTSIILLAVPFSLIGAIWFLYGLDYHMSIAVWVGFIALMGLDAETGVFMLLYLDMAHDEREKKGLLKSEADLHEAIIEGAVKRVRPKMMTVCAALLGLLPIMWATGTGADVMKHIAAPMIGGLVTSFGLELLVYPAIYLLWKKRSLLNPLIK